MFVAERDRFVGVDQVATSRALALKSVLIVQPHNPATRRDEPESGRAPQVQNIPRRRDPRNLIGVLIGKRRINRSKRLVPHIRSP
jgi:hypothetical protein